MKLRLRPTAAISAVADQQRPRPSWWRRRSKALARVGVLMAVAALGLVVTPGQALAASSMCSINGRLWWIPCQTYSVWANPSSHTVDYHIMPYAGCTVDFVVRDVANNVVVRSGRSGSHDGVVWGLYSAYRLEVSTGMWGCGGNFIIENE